MFGVKVSADNDPDEEDQEEVEKKEENDDEEEEEEEEEEAVEEEEDEEEQGYEEEESEDLDSEFEDYVHDLEHETEKLNANRDENQVISIKIIAERSLGQLKYSKMSSDDIADAALKLTHIRLDEERIAKIDNLEVLSSNVTHLFLQRNRISKIENLEFLTRLQLLCLASNKIVKVENLRTLANLRALDLGYNLINFFQPDELPPALLFLTTDGNPLSGMTQNDWAAVFLARPSIRQHDCKDVIREQYESAPETDETGDADESDSEAPRLPSPDLPAAEPDAAARPPEEGQGEGSVRERQAAGLRELVRHGEERLAAAKQMFEEASRGMRDRRAEMLQRQRRELEREAAEAEGRFDAARRSIQALRDGLPPDESSAALALQPPKAGAAGGKTATSVPEQLIEGRRS